MPFVGFEHTIPASERAKTVHALDRWVTVTGSIKNKVLKIEGEEFNLYNEIREKLLREQSDFTPLLI
jgi:hypothetical protein